MDKYINFCEGNQLAVHGIGIEIYDQGILITGKSGIGKSELALELIDRGHKLISDDLVYINQIEDNLILKCPEFGYGFLEIRGIGFININDIYSDKSLINQAPFFLIIELVEHEHLDKVKFDRLKQLIYSTKVLDKQIAKYELPVGANRHLPILVELAVKYARSFANGYDSHHAFIQEQQKFLQANG